jgi:hypothetical protein
VIWGSLMGLLVPKHLLGRVASIDWLFTIAFIPVAYTLVGPLASLIGARATLLASGVTACILDVLFLLFLPGLHDTEHTAPAPSA